MAGLNYRKVAVIGCGFVGAASAFAIMESGLFSEMPWQKTLASHFISFASCQP
nr:hypothetical protein [Butyrivibrio sp. AE3006]